MTWCSQLVGAPVSGNNVAAGSDRILTTMVSLRGVKLIQAKTSRN